LVHQSLDGRENIVNRPETLQRRASPFQTFPVHVGMDVDDAGNNGASLKVDSFGPSGGQGKHIPVAPHRLYRVASDGQGLVDHAIGGRSEHFAVVQHYVRDTLSRYHSGHFALGKIEKAWDLVGESGAGGTGITG
jgi:hypothetical protein